LRSLVDQSQREQVALLVVVGPVDEAVPSQNRPDLLGLANRWALPK